MILVEMAGRGYKRKILVEMARRARRRVSVTVPRSRRLRLRLEGEVVPTGWSVTVTDKSVYIYWMNRKRDYKKWWKFSPCRAGGLEVCPGRHDGEHWSILRGYGESREDCERRQR